MAALRNGQIGPPEMEGLLRAILGRIEETRGNATRARSDADLAHARARDSLVCRTDGGDSSARDEMSFCDDGFAKLQAEISRAEQEKIAALEHETCTAESALLRLDDTGADVGAMQPALHASFGFLPLSPVEPSALFVVDADLGVTRMSLCVSRAVFAAQVIVSPPSATWVASGTAVIVSVTIAGGHLPPSCIAESRVTLLALSSRLQASASLSPFGVIGPSLPLPTECIVNDTNISLTIDVPALRPTGAAEWVVRATLFDPRGLELVLGSLAMGMRVFFGHSHSGTCNHASGHLSAGEMYLAAFAGSVPRIVAALQSGRSTDETNGVREAPPPFQSEYFDFRTLPPCRAA